MTIGPQDWAFLVRLNGFHRSPREHVDGEKSDCADHLVAKRALDSALAAFALTPAQHEVAVRFVLGESPEEIAGFRETSPYTIKAQIRELYVAADVSSREQFTGEVLKRVLRIFSRELSRFHSDATSRLPPATSD